MLRFIIIPFIFCTLGASQVLVSEFANGISQFSLELYKQCGKSLNGNIILSPFSVTTSMTTLLLASNGLTFEQLKNGLHLNGNKSTLASQYFYFFDFVKRNGGKTSAFSMANQIYLQRGYSVNKHFQEIAIKIIKSGVGSMNFSNKIIAARTINHFVEKKTNGKIKNMIQPDSINSNGSVILVSAIHFKCAWEQPFFEQETKKGDFYVNDTKNVRVDFMYIDEWFNYADLPDLDASALQMKYNNSNLSMIFLLPNSHNGIAAMEIKLRHFDLKSMTDKMSMRKVDVKIPKFAIEFEINLNHALKNLGMSEIFTKNAGLNGILGSGEPINVSDIFHKSYINVTEGGSEAAAATGERYKRMSFVFYVPNFHADHPFMYYIWDSYVKTTVFIGRVTNFN